MNRSIFTITLVTLLGMVGLYILLFRAYQIYQQQTKPGTVGGLLSNLGGNP